LQLYAVICSYMRPYAVGGAKIENRPQVPMLPFQRMTGTLDSTKSAR
jgi:hypothetical protein